MNGPPLRRFLQGLADAEDMPMHHAADIDQYVTEVLDSPVRPDWDDYFLGIAQAVAARGECTRSRVGAVLVRDRRIMATGYNGVAAGELSCLDGMCPRAQNDVPKSTPYEGVGYCIAHHAEDNVLADAYAREVEVLGCTIYLTKEPCERCAFVLTSLSLDVVWYDVTKGRGGATRRGRNLEPPR